MNLLTFLFGRVASKAVAAGIAGAVSTTAVSALEACDAENLGASIGAAAGAFVIGHLVTWLAPKNREHA